MPINCNVNPTSANCIQPKEAEVSSFDHLPSEIIQQIFSHLNILELGRCCQVNRSWQTLASDNALWKKLFPQIELSQNENIKAYVGNHNINSEATMMDRLREFASKIFLQDKGSFTCFYARHSGVYFTAIFGNKGKVLSSDKPNLQETWISLENLSHHVEGGQSVIEHTAKRKHTCELIHGKAFSSAHRVEFYASIGPILEKRLNQLEEMVSNASAPSN